MIFDSLPKENRLVECLKFYKPYYDECLKHNKKSHCAQVGDVMRRICQISGNQSFLDDGLYRRCEIQFVEHDQEKERMKCCIDGGGKDDYCNIISSYVYPPKQKVTIRFYFFIFVLILIFIKLTIYFFSSKRGVT